MMMEHVRADMRIWIMMLFAFILEFIIVRMQKYTKFFYFDASNCENHIKCDRFCIFLWQIDTGLRIFRYFCNQNHFFWKRANSLSVEHRITTRDQHDTTMAGNSFPESGRGVLAISAVSCKGRRNPDVHCCLSRVLRASFSKEDS